MARVLHESEVLPEAVFTPKAAASLSFLSVEFILLILSSLSLSSPLFKEKLFKPGSRRGSPVSSISSLHEDRRSCFSRCYSSVVSFL